MHNKCLFNKQCTYHYQMKIIYFNSILKTIFKNMLKDYLTILIEDFNINMLKKEYLNQQHFKTLCTNTN